MILNTSSFYTQPGYYFSISHKVDLFIRNKLIELIMIPYGLDKKDPKTFLGLDVGTSSKTTQVEVRGPSYDKKNNFINWGLWLPYNEIANAPDQIPPYIKYFFDATAIVLEKYGVKEEDVRKVQKVVESEVINNPEYIFEEEIIPTPDLSDLGL